MYRSILGLVLILIPALPLFADISGTVVDEDSNALEGVLVTLQATNNRTMTNADGEFTLEDTTGTALVIVGAFKGYFNGAITADDGDTDAEITLEAVPQDNDEEYEFKEATFCRFCHPDHEEEWEDSPMGNTGKNRWVFDVYAGTGTPDGSNGFVYVDDSIQYETFPSHDCAACHQPAFWIQEGEKVAMDPLAGQSDAAEESVTCDICHKVADIDVDKIMWPGVQEVYVTLTRPQGPAPLEQVQYGVRGDVDFVDSDAMRASYNPQLQAEVCGMCHEDTNDPNVNHEYDGADAVPIQTTYSEWKASDYADPTSDRYQTCADCHMPVAEEDDQELCNELDEPLLRPANHRHYHDIRGRNAEFLENALTMEMEVEEVDREILVTVSLTNDKTGHDIPGGNPLQHMVLLVEVSIDGEPLEHLGDQVMDEMGGQGDPADGEWEGQPGKVFARVLEDIDGNFPVFYSESVAQKYDTRLPIDVTDVTEYAFAVPHWGGEVDIRARLIYRRAWRGMLQDKGWTTTGQGETLLDIVEPHFGQLMEEATDTIVTEKLPGGFMRGDVDGSGSVFAILDAIYLLDYGFNEGPEPPCLDAADADDSGDIFAIIDAVMILEYGFGLGTELAAPGPDRCGLDPTDDDELDCATFSGVCE